MKSTYYHSKYFANLLTLQNSSKSIDRLSQSIFDAQIDLNPHQVEAALFAFKSPLSNGVILADEVGLGKTIEAGLALCQYWSERKRKIIIVAPASLRKQWSMELKEKFFIDSIIIDGPVFKEEYSQGKNNPFIQKDKVVITSYQFVANKKENVFLADFDLAIIDEAHKLRNFHKGEKAKTTCAINSALSKTKKLLLTATPLQNSLLEIYGLVSILDPYVFGEKRAFSKQFNGTLTVGDLEELKERLKPYVHRTLRKDVLEYIKYTKRVPLVEEFTPTDDEVALYNLISEFLMNEDLYSIPRAQRSLITLVVRKLLASSTQAIIGTIETMINRLKKLKKEKHLKIDTFIQFDDEFELIEDYIEEEFDEISIEESDVEFAQKDIDAIQREIEQLSAFLDIACTIEIDSKVKALMSALEKGFDHQNNLGGNKKAIIFTESKRTQKFLYDYLQENGFADKVVLFNGTNSDKKSKEIYKKWILKHEGSDRITGSKASDMKQAIVDFFKEDAEIMIATEAGSEGINLQFCNLLINYDLPWNPQRIEQRIGRVHRYGQKHDVVVINFINKKNAADRRVYELLSHKFKLFEGVFGVSDEVLGAIESGVDFEKRILSIYQSCRTTEQIEEAFDLLRDEFKDDIDEKTKNTREKLLEHFDEDVHLRLKNNLARTNENIDNFSVYLYNIAVVELNKYAKFFNKHEFEITSKINDEIQKGKYSLLKKNEENVHFLRIGSALGEYIINSAKNRALEKKRVIFDLSNHEYKISALEQYLNKHGYLKATKITIKSYDTEEYIVLSALSSEYKKIEDDVINKLFSLKANISNKVSFDSNDDIQLENYYKDQKKIILAENEKFNTEHFNDASIKLHKWSDDKLNEINKELHETKLKIKELNRSSSLTERIEDLESVQISIRDQEKKRRKIQKEIFAIEEDIEEQRDELIESLQQAKEQTVVEEILFEIEWEIR